MELQAELTEVTFPLHRTSTHTSLVLLML